jgi:hypothetical protein
MFVFGVENEDENMILDLESNARSRLKLKRGDVDCVRLSCSAYIHPGRK